MGEGSASTAHAALEADLRALAEVGAYDEAATIALRRAGPELLRFLVHAHGDEATGSDAFSLLAEDIWRGLAGFRWESSFRTWAYALARRASARIRKRGRREGIFEPLSNLGPLSAIVEEIRTHTLSVIRGERQSALEVLRAELDIDERMLLSLRVERALSWPEIAVILADDEALDPAAPARLRKRFQLLKDRLKKRGRELGLVPSERDG